MRARCQQACRALCGCWRKPKGEAWHEYGCVTVSGQFEGAKARAFSAERLAPTQALG